MNNTGPASANSKPPTTYDPAAGAFYQPSALPGGPSNQGLWVSPTLAAAEGAYALRMQAIFDSLYLEARLNKGDISIEQIQGFRSLHPEIMVSFGLLVPIDTPTKRAGEGGFIMGAGGLYGWYIQTNPFALAGMMASPAANPWLYAAWASAYAAPFAITGAAGIDWAAAAQDVAATGGDFNAGWWGAEAGTTPSGEMSVAQGAGWCCSWIYNILKNWP